MKRVFTIIIAANTLLAACSKQAGLDELVPQQQEFGNIEISVVDNTTRAERNTIWLNQMYPDWTAPLWYQTLGVVLVNEEQDVELDDSKNYKAYRSITLFNDSREELPAGDEHHYSVKIMSQDSGNGFYGYTDAATGAKVTWNNALFSTAQLVPDAPEDIRAPYFEGKASGIDVEAGVVTNIDVQVYVANSAICFDFSESFQKYFPEAHLTLTTAAGKTFNVDYSESAPYVKTYFWVNPRAVTIKGTVKRQPSGSEYAGAEETLEDMTFTDVQARTCYTFKYDLDTVGGTAAGGINITYDDQPIGEISLGDFEVNPEV